MAQVAWQKQADTESDIVRRLVASPLRRAHDQPPAARLTLVPPSPSELDPIDADEEPSPDLLRLKTEMTLMKAVLKAQRSENAELRSQLGQAGHGTVEDVRQVRDRWAILVDQLLRQPR